MTYYGIARDCNLGSENLRFVRCNVRSSIYGCAMVLPAVLFCRFLGCYVLLSICVCVHAGVCACVRFCASVLCVLFLSVLIDSCEVLVCACVCVHARECVYACIRYCASVLCVLFNSLCVHRLR